MNENENGKKKVDDKIDEDDEKIVNIYKNDENDKKKFI